ncbi:hypothetical protein BDP55DRAFT_15938 [Colletotrichum godetiae]|uniref:Uncharacterized protein n=1 Tax=Colletotrichum godetiae TaxID=1209918 RepID=A0AAJ0AZQ6_9PEZI|nr:uncharacterized protein BDP55DRAFT_15938 [Colletotrichum godetiae]KAK1701288.1 hypothetical protein BDP55DRAFT_15938 [Colletotrichum godetiae]
MVDREPTYRRRRSGPESGLAISNLVRAPQSLRAPSANRLSPSVPTPNSPLIAAGLRVSPPARPFPSRSINEPLAPPAAVGSGRGMLGRETLSRLLNVDFEIKFAARNYTP